MLYLKSLVMHNFKSFKRAELLFSKGFTCVVGPNGSGKSNICDAVLFVMGENSLHRMRVDKMQSLINFSAASKKGSMPKAHVKVVLGGDENIEILRVAREDGKSFFKVNGKRMKRREVLELLGKYNLVVNETNTITQGEINKMLDLNPKERRELIDIAAGIKDFDEKKKEALSELEKVNQRIGEAQVLLNERLGFLKELEKEKQAAESYIALSSRNKQLNFSILKARELEAAATYGKYSDTIKKLESDSAGIDKQLGDIEAQLAKLGEFRKQLTKELGESSSAMSTVNSRHDFVSRAIASAEAELEGIKKAASLAVEKKAKLEGELAGIKAQLVENARQLADTDASIASITKQLAVYESNETASEREAKLAETEEKISNFEMELTSVQEAISSLQAEVSTQQAMQNEYVERIAALRKNRDMYEREMEQQMDNSAELSRRVSDLDKAIAQKEEEKKGFQERIDASERKQIELKEQLALSRPRESSVAEKIGARFGPSEGYYGTAASLCSYDAEYALAIESAARSRLNYLVVRSLDDAARIIEYMKSNGIGTATFIPLEELKVKFTGEEKGLEPLIAHVKFEQKYRSAFEYIFNDTFLVRDISDAKRAGIGKHRYATMGGEVIESSGVVSGGYERIRVSPKSIEASIEKLSQEISALRHTMEMLDESIAKMKREKSKFEADIAAKQAGISERDKMIRSIDLEIEKYGSMLSSIGIKIKNGSARLADLNKKKNDTALLLDEARRVASGIYEESLGIARAKGSKGAAAKAKEARDELEKLKIRRTEIATQDQMQQKRAAEIVKELESIAAEVRSAAASIAGKEKELEQLHAEKSTLEEKIKSSSESNRKAYESLDNTDSEIARLSSEKGKLESIKESTERQLNDARMRASQLEVRLGDLKAELAAYPEGIEQLKMDVGAMEEWVQARAAWQRQPEGAGGLRGKAQGG